MHVRHRIMSVVLVAASAVGLGSPALAAERQYVGTDLGSLNGGPTEPAALNDADVVVGTSGSHAFRWQDGQITDLGTLGGATSSAADVNESGVIAGTSTDAAGRDHAVVWRGTSIVDLGFGKAVGINDLGQVIGDRVVAAGPRRLIWIDGKLIDLGDTGAAPFATIRLLWQDGHTKYLGLVPEGTYTTGINNRGDIIGTFPEPPGQPCGCTSSAGIIHNGQVTTFGSFAPSTFNPASISIGYNNNGDVVGLAAIENGLSRPFRWHDGTMTQLPNLGGYEGAAFGVNDDGLAVGDADTNRMEPVSEPVTWTGSVLNVLSDQGLVSDDRPRGINNRGDIITVRVSHGSGPTPAYIYR